MTFPVCQKPVVDRPRSSSTSHVFRPDAVLSVTRCFGCLFVVVTLATPFCLWLRNVDVQTEVLTGAPSLPFTDVTEEAGIRFAQHPGPLGTYYLPEIMGSGCALLDYDNDGDLDVLLLHPMRTPVDASRSVETATNRLYRQEPDGTYVDVTGETGLGESGSGVACAVGDIDNDGHDDLYFANIGRDRLFRNRGDGRFEDVTDLVGLNDDDWTTGAAFLDYDRDGWLDLFAVNYVRDPLYGLALACNYGDDRITYCGPLRFLPAGDRLLHNGGATADQPVPRFHDVTAVAGLSESAAAGLSLFCCDMNGDGWDDVYVANDECPNQLWINQHDGTFVDEAVFRGCALDKEGKVQAGMGLAFGDIDRNGATDIISTHLFRESSTLYQNLGNGMFVDASRLFGLRNATYFHTSWGSAMIDVDHDGDLDFVCVNGFVRPFQFRGLEPSHQPEARRDVIEDRAAYWEGYRDKNQLLKNIGDGFLQDVSELVGDFSATPGNARGLAHGDMDNDGDIDLLVTYVGSSARLYRNDVPKQGHWLQVRAEDAGVARHAIGALITVTANGRSWQRTVTRSGSYLSSNDPRVHFGVGSASTYERIVVRWPDGFEETFAGGATDRSIVLKRGDSAVR